MAYKILSDGLQLKKLSNGLLKMVVHLAPEFNSGVSVEKFLIAMLFDS